MYIGTLGNDSHWETLRIYQKFYDFQIALLQQFPQESITTQRRKRLLLLMPLTKNLILEIASSSEGELLLEYSIHFREGIPQSILGKMQGTYIRLRC